MAKKKRRNPDHVRSRHKPGPRNEVIEAQLTDLLTPAVEEVEGLAGYDGFVVGSAPYAGGWMKPAAAFLRANQGALAGHPVWLFSSGPTGEGDPNDLLWTAGPSPRT
jgi:hypothetical protein